MTLADRVLRTIRRETLMRPGARVLVALSGGPDSVALLHLLRELEHRGELSVVGLGHFNHQLRAEAADEDERFCRALAANLSLPIEVGRADVRALAREQRRSIEDAARAARYEFLEGAASRRGADVIAVGHSRDDQAETFLLRLIRGAGPRGLAGIHPRAGRIVRPLLDLSRAELRAYAAERHLPFREDATNADVSIPRNRVRHELMPYLAREFSPGIMDVLAREAAIAREDENRLHAEATDLLESVVLEVAEDARPCGRAATGSRRHVALDAARLASLHPALASRVVREVLGSLVPGRFVGFEHIQRMLELAGEGRTGGAISLPGVVAVREGGRIVVGPEAEAGFSNSFQFPLSIPGEVLLDAQGWAVSADWGKEVSTTAQASERGAQPAGGHEVPGRRQTRLQTGVRSEAVRLPLAVRSRRPGDRFRPAGMGGRAKKLQDFLVDRKIPRATRDALPLVVDADDRIVWVVGHPAAEDFRVTEPSQGVILLKARRLGGPG